PAGAHRGQTRRGGPCRHRRKRAEGRAAARPCAEARTREGRSRRGSGARRPRVLTGVALAIPGSGVRERLVETMIAMKRLSDEEIAYYANHGEWRGKA